MTQLSVSPNAGDQLAAASVDVLERPRLAPNVEPVGELMGSGFRDRQFLVLRNGRFLQVTELLYRVAEQVDGRRTLAEIAARVSERMDRWVSADQVRHVLTKTLIPRGLIASAAGRPIPQRSDELRSPMAINVRMKMVGPRVVDPLARVLQPLYAPPILIPVLIAVAAAHGWLYFGHGIEASLRAALFTPGGLFVLIALLLLSSVFHELGHAAALRYGGGRVRGMGAGLYIIYPVLYTDVTDSYRLSRLARLRTDLGGFYFHLIFALGILGLAVVSGKEFLLFGVPLIDLAIIRQCLPFVRWDGYWVMADLTGVPDFFASIGPFILGLLPGKAARRNTLPRLKPWVKAVFALYIVITIPVLAILYVLMVRGLPYFIATTLDAFRLQIAVGSGAWSTADGLQVAAALTQIAFLGLPLLGIGYVLYATGRRLIPVLWRWSRPTPPRRAIGILLTAGLVGLVSLAWGPQLPTLLGSEPSGVQHFTVTDRSHVSGSVAYPQDPPVGGPHASLWWNCGFYASPIPTEYAVHSLEHGAVWITYQPDLPGEQIAVLRQLTSMHSYVLVSPYPGLQTPVVASAWGSQLMLESPRDTRLTQFVRALERGPRTPEPTAPCSGGAGHFS